MTNSINNLTGTDGVREDKDARGHQVFWSLPVRDYDVQGIIYAAIYHEVPTWLTNKLVGKTADSAFKKAVQIGAKGKFSAAVGSEDEDDTWARYLIRDVKGTGERVLIRETIKRGSKKPVAVVNMALLSVNPLGGVFSTPAEEGQNHPAFAECEGIISRMDNAAVGYVGTIDESKIRRTILDWLAENHRISLRPTGGVYLIPNPSNEQKRIKMVSELIAIMAWVEDDLIGGMFTNVVIFDSPMTRTTNLVDLAATDIMTEINELQDRLKNLNKPSVNAGARGNSAKTVVEASVKIKEKIAAVKDAFSLKAMTVEIMLEAVANSSVKVRDQAWEEVESERQRRDQMKPQTKNGGKRTGTAQKKNKNV